MYLVDPPTIIHVNKISIWNSRKQIYFVSHFVNITCILYVLNYLVIREYERAILSSFNSKLRLDLKLLP